MFEEFEILLRGKYRAVSKWPTCQILVFWTLFDLVSGLSTDDFYYTALKKRHLAIKLAELPPLPARFWNRFHRLLVIVFGKFECGKRHENESNIWWFDSGSSELRSHCTESGE
jgi:hypothetical protein